MIRLEVKDGGVNLADYIYDDSNNQHPKYHSAALVKWRDITLWRGFDDLHNTIGTEDGVMDDMCTPSVTVLYAVTIYGITFHHLTNEDAVVDDNGVHGVV